MSRVKVIEKQKNPELENAYQEAVQYWKPSAKEKKANTVDRLNKVGTKNSV